MIFKLKLTLNEVRKLCTSIYDKDITQITHLAIEGKIAAEDYCPF